LFWVKLFLLTIKLKVKIKKQHRKNKAVCPKKVVIDIDSLNSGKLALVKAINMIKKTMTKFIGFDLLKMLVIINSFCIFAS
jgi:hypothetical protein